jgi:hypothetical protein
MTLDNEIKQHLEELLDKSLESFEGLRVRWDELKPHKQFSIDDSENFHLGYLFGSIEENFISWFYSKYGRSMSDKEYHEYWLVCRQRIRTMHEKFDSFYFQE